MLWVEIVLIFYSNFWYKNNNLVILFTYQTIIYIHAQFHMHITKCEAFWLFFFPRDSTFWCLEVNIPLIIGKKWIPCFQTLTNHFCVYSKEGQGNSFVCDSLFNWFCPFSFFLFRLLIYVMDSEKKLYIFSFWR